MNKSRTKKLVNKIGKYLWELSIVVIGITITLSANNWINDRSERKTLNLYLNTVKLELEENLKIVNSSKEFYKRSFEYVVYLSSNEKRALNPDSLKSYSDIQHNITLFTYKSNALDMLKFSGKMSLIKDKEILQHIWSCYADLEDIKQIHDLAMQLKIEEGKKEEKEEDLTGKAIAIPMYNFFHNNDIHQQMKNNLDKMSDEIEQTLLQLK
jgi:hypothetical protein